MSWKYHVVGSALIMVAAFSYLSYNLIKAERNVTELQETIASFCDWSPICQGEDKPSACEKCSLGRTYVLEEKRGEEK